MSNAKLPLGIKLNESVIELDLDARLLYEEIRAKDAGDFWTSLKPNACQIERRDNRTDFTFTGSSDLILVITMEDDVEDPVSVDLYYTPKVLFSPSSDWVDGGKNGLMGEHLSAVYRNTEAADVIWVYEGTDQLRRDSIFSKPHRATNYSRHVTEGIEERLRFVFPAESGTVGRYIEQWVGLRIPHDKLSIAEF